MNTVLRVTQNVKGQMWKQMFVSAEQWKSEVEFFEVEMDFLGDLVNKHFTMLIGEHNLSKTSSLTSILTEMGKRNETLLQDIQAHMNRLAGLFENPFAHDAQECKNQHENLEARVASLSRDFKSIKMEVFALAKTALASEKGARRLP